MQDYQFKRMTFARLHPVGHMLFEAEDVVIGDRKVVILYDFLSFGLGSVPCSITKRQLAMETFVETTGLEGAMVKTFVPIQRWRSKLGTFPYATDGLIFVPAMRESYATESKYKWKVRRPAGGNRYGGSVCVVCVCVCVV